MNPTLLQFVALNYTCPLCSWRSNAHQEKEWGWHFWWCPRHTHPDPFTRWCRQRHGFDPAPEPLAQEGKR